MQGIKYSKSSKKIFDPKQWLIFVHVLATLSTVLSVVAAVYTATTIVESWVNQSEFSENVDKND